MPKLYKFYLFILILCAFISPSLYAMGGAEAKPDKYYVSKSEYSVFTNVAREAFYYYTLSDEVSQWVELGPFKDIRLFFSTTNETQRAYVAFLREADIIKDLSPQAYFYLVRKGISLNMIGNYLVNWHHSCSRCSHEDTCPLVLIMYVDYIWVAEQSIPSEDKFVINQNFITAHRRDPKFFAKENYFIAIRQANWSNLFTKGMKNHLDLERQHKGTKYYKLQIKKYNTNISSMRKLKYGGINSHLYSMQYNFGSMDIAAKLFKSDKYTIEGTYGSISAYYFWNWINNYLFLVVYLRDLKKYHPAVYRKIQKRKDMVFMIQKTYTEYYQFLMSFLDGVNYALKNNKIPNRNEYREKYLEIQGILKMLLYDKSYPKAVRDLSAGGEFMGDWDIESHIKELKSFGLEVKKIE